MADGPDGDDAWPGEDLAAAFADLLRVDAHLPPTLIQSIESRAELKEWTDIVGNNT